MARTQGHGNPKWSREEIILALDLYFKLDGKIPKESDPRVIELSSLLKGIPRIDKLKVRESFRNSSGVTFKLQNLHQLATGKGLGNVSQADRNIWEQYGSQPALVGLIATQIKEGLKELNTSISEMPESDDLSFSEGSLLTRLHNHRERNASVRNHLLSDRRLKGTLECDLCGFAGLSRVADLLESQFEAHHIIPLAYGSIRETELSEMALLCANCHRLTHKIISIKKTWISIEEIKMFLISKV